MMGVLVVSREESGLPEISRVLPRAKHPTLSTLAPSPRTVSGFWCYNPCTIRNSKSVFHCEPHSSHLNKKNIPKYKSLKNSLCLNLEYLVEIMIPINKRQGLGVVGGIGRRARVVDSQLVVRAATLLQHLNNSNGTRNHTSITDISNQSSIISSSSSSSIRGRRVSPQSLVEGWESCVLSQAMTGGVISGVEVSSAPGQEIHFKIKDPVAFEASLMSKGWSGRHQNINDRRLIDIAGFYRGLSGGVMMEVNGKKCGRLEVVHSTKTSSSRTSDISWTLPAEASHITGHSYGVFVVWDVLPNGRRGRILGWVQ